eukprot:4145582-Alexandrium_andersonii.AAC.1
MVRQAPLQPSTLTPIQLGAANTPNAPNAPNASNAQERPGAANASAEQNASTSGEVDARIRNSFLVAGAQAQCEQLRAPGPSEASSSEAKRGSEQGRTLAANSN